MTPWRRRLRRARIALTLSLACLVILGAVLVGLRRLLLPQVGLHKARVEALLSDQLQRPVSIDAVEGYWGDSGPLLRLDGVHVASADVSVAPLVIPQAELGIDLGAWLGRSRRWSEFRIAGVNVDLVRRSDGGWRRSGPSWSRVSRPPLCRRCILPWLARRHDRPPECGCGPRCFT